MIIRQQWILLAILVISIVAGAQGVWIQYPLSQSVPGLDWRGLDPSWWRRFAAAPFLLFLTAALFFLLTGKTRRGSLFLAASLIAILAVPELALLSDPTWLQTYVEDGSQYDKFQFFIPFLGGIPSTNFSPYLNGPDKFQYLPDRARIIMAMLGWGWNVCLIGLFALTLFLRRIGKLPSLRVVLLSAAAGVLLIAVIGSDTVRADLSYRNGDQLLGMGDYKHALQAYTRAIELDPQLANSSVYLQNVAKTYYQLGGASDPRAYLFIADAITVLGQEGAKALLVASTNSNDDSVLGKALSGMAQRRIADMWLNESIRAYKHGDLGSAILGLRRVLLENKTWRHARFFQARILSKLREFDEASLQYNTLLATVSNNSIKAAIYSALGDTHAAAGYLADARKYYGMSYALDKTGNLWGIRGLGGT